MIIIIIIIIIILIIIYFNVNEVLFERPFETSPQAGDKKKFFWFSKFKMKRKKSALFCVR